MSRISLVAIWTFYKETNMAFFPAVLTLLVVYDIIETEKIKQGFV